MSKKKEKKEKITYYDDGRTIADMSSVGGGKKKGYRPASDYKSIWQTYWSAVKMMFKPMLVVVGIICLAFLIMYLMLLLNS